MTHHYRPSKLEDCAKLAPYMREQDKTEIMYSNGVEPLEALLKCFAGSQECNSIIHEDGDVVGMFGVCDSNIFASPWLLGSDKIIDTRKEFIPQAKEWVDRMSQQYPILLNYVHEDNTVSLRWLKSLGFEFIKLDKEYGVGKKPFYQFVRITNHV
ncbi:MAG: putative scaffold protein [Prokaryotic dsDNA virus sp.]|jgi:hypothetical protein|nr:MAG: putative scaffold protein [Prokaryotic dsDNA virus sp.]|tara:strand:- start:3261 stop:3725 length:465 start_codon:yes stop_codon:yes gene_type:complete